MENKKIIIDRSALKDSKGRYLTQSLFLELGYKEQAVFTLKDDHYTYNNKFYPSLKKLYLEEGDVTEYQFANKYLLGWASKNQSIDGWNGNIGKRLQKI